MAYYTVKDISETLGVSQETVRRWIRAGKLKSELESRKGGNLILKVDLNRFLKCKPKYLKRAKEYKETSKMDKYFEVKLAIRRSSLTAEDKVELLDMVDAMQLQERKAGPARLDIREGHIVKAEGPNPERRLLIVVKILSDIKEDYGLKEHIVVVYDVLARELDWRGLNLLSNPDMCEIIGLTDPKQIFREDIKI